MCAPLYPQNLPESVVGIKSQEIGLTCEVFHKAVEGSLSHEEIDQVQKVDHVDNQLAHEIFEYAEKNLGRMTDCRKVFFIIQGHIGNFSDQALYNSYARLKTQLNDAKNAHSSKRQDLVKSFNEAKFKFPSGANEIFEEILFEEEGEVKEIIRKYEKNVKT